MEIDIDQSKLRHVAGAFATGIGVAAIMDDDLNIYGMTINSFLSVSLTPPLVLFSADNKSNILKYCQEGKEMTINLLSDNQKEVSDHYAGYLDKSNGINIFTEGRFPLMADALAWYKLKINQLIPAGDHHLVLCDVLDCHRDDQKEPILFYKGYRTIGPVLED